MLLEPIKQIPESLRLPDSPPVSLGDLLQDSSILKGIERASSGLIGGPGNLGGFGDDNDRLRRQSVDHLGRC